MNSQNNHKLTAMPTTEHENTKHETKDVLIQVD